MRDLRGEIDVALALFERVEIVGEACPVERHAGGHHDMRNVLHPFHQADHEILVPFPARGEADAAIPHDDGGDTMVRGRRHPAFPGDLTVIMSVDVDEAGRHDQAAGVDFLFRGAMNLSDLDDQAVLYRHVGRHSLAAASIDDGSAADDQLIISAHRTRSPHVGCY